MSFFKPPVRSQSAGGAAGAVSLASSWDDVGFASDKDVPAFLEAVGLSKYAQKIIELTDAQSVGDLRLLDKSMVEDVVKQADLKMVPAQKFRRALEELHGELQVGTSTPDVPPVEGPNGVAAPPAVAADGASSTSGACAPATPSVPAPLEECIAICIDRSGSMGSPFAELNLDNVRGAVAQRTRMEAVKAMFYAFRDRVESVGRGGHQLGLIQFDSVVEQLLDLTPRLDRFEAIVDDMEKRGQTAIYSAILKGIDMLEPQFTETSSVDLRIVVLTDGQSNTGAASEEALAAAFRIGAVVDAIIVGDRPDGNLRKIVNATGGECYVIGNLGEGFELLESEAVVSLRARRGGAEKPPFQRREVPKFEGIEEKGMTRGTAVSRAPTLAPNLAKTAVVDMATIVASPPPQAGNSSTACIKRVMKEINQIASDGSGDGIHIFPGSDNILFWRVLLEGPPSTPFEGGVFCLTVEIPNAYPFSPPKIRFETPIYHCNVSDSGSICLDVLNEHWNPALSVCKALQSIRAVVREPNTDDALRQWIAELTIALRQHGDTRYIDQASEHTRKHASLSVAEWRAKWGC